MTKTSSKHTSPGKAIITLSTMEEVHQAIAHCPTQPHALLAAFDVDMTLTVPRHPACHYPNLKQHKRILQALLEPLNEVEEDKIITLGAQQPGQMLAEKNTPSTIQKLQHQGIKTIAFTASLTGELVALGIVQSLRFRDLQALDMDFRPAFDTQDFLLPKIPSYNENHAMYHQGVLYANGGRGERNKGAVLVAFLQEIKWKPEQIVMVDDVPKNLTDIVEALDDFDPTIQFLGIDYHGARMYAPEAISEEAFARYWQAVVDQVRGKR